MTSLTDDTKFSLEDLATKHADELAVQAIHCLAQISRLQISVLLNHMFDQIDGLLSAAALEEDQGQRESYALGLQEVRRQRQTMMGGFWAADQTLTEDSLHEALAGSWFEFNHENQPVRANLSRANPVGSKYLFVDQNGATVANKTMLELTADIKAGKAIILESSPLFERAPGARASRLQDQ